MAPYIKLEIITAPKLYLYRIGQIISLIIYLSKNLYESPYDNLLGKDFCNLIHFSVLHYHIIAFKSMCIAGFRKDFCNLIHFSVLKHIICFNQDIIPVYAHCFILFLQRKSSHNGVIQINPWWLIENNQKVITLFFLSCTLKV